jgi:hypothetical protein
MDAPAGAPASPKVSGLNLERENAVWSDEVSIGCHRIHPFLDHPINVLFPRLGRHLKWTGGRTCLPGENFRQRR